MAEWDLMLFFGLFLTTLYDHQQDHKHCDRAESRQRDIKDHIGVIACLGRLGVVGLDGELFDLKLPVEIADGFLEVVAELDRDIESDVQIDICARVEGAKVDPIGELSGLIGGCLEEVGVAVLRNRQLKLG